MSSPSLLKSGSFETDAKRVVQHGVKRRVPLVLSPGKSGIYVSGRVIQREHIVQLIMKQDHARPGQYGQNHDPQADGLEGRLKNDERDHAAYNGKPRADGSHQ